MVTGNELTRYQANQVYYYNSKYVHRNVEMQNDGIVDLEGR